MFKRKLLSGLMALMLTAVMIMPVYADQISDQQKILDELNQKMNQQQNNWNNASRAEKSIMGQVQDIEKDVNQTQQDISTLEGKVSYLQSSIGILEKQIKSQQKDLEKQTELLGDRLVVIYEEGDSSYLEVLLGATDIKDFITRFDMLSTIVEQDRDMIDSINSKKKDLDTKIANLQVQKNELEAAQGIQEEKQIALSDKLDQKKDVLDGVKNEKAKYAQAIAELEQASQEAEAMIRRLQGNGQGSSIGTGSYTWPTPGYRSITSPYGMRYHPILKTNKLHTGIDIGAPSGAKIVAADGGTVIFSGWFGAYGNAIIIDHGAGISTLYGHQSQLLVSQGQTVVKGQTIGKVGSTGWSTGPHLHFEVRKNGTPVNPRGYV